jgi:hypothetical protein
MRRSVGKVKICPSVEVAKASFFRWIVVLNISVFGKRRRFRVGRLGQLSSEGKKL